MSDHGRLLFIALLAIGLLVWLVAYAKLSSFLALVLASLFVGVFSGMNLGEVGKAFQEGMGAVLGAIAMVIGLGTVLGKMLAESGGAGQITRTLVRTLGVKHIHWAVAIIGFLVGFPVFFAVGFVLLVPIVLALVRETRSPVMLLAMPLVTGLGLVHSLVPPHPGVMAAIGILKADVGKAIFYSLLVAFPITLLIGPALGKIAAARVPVEAGGKLAEQFARPVEAANPPGFGLTVLAILLPVLLMLLSTVADLVVAADSPLRPWSSFIGHPIVALTLSVLFSFYAFGFARGMNRQQILKHTEECLGPIALILLIVGAGGGFSKVLIASGVGNAISESMAGWKMSPFLLGWLMAAAIRLATGSATVAITAAAGLIAPVLAAHPQVRLELLIVALGAGSMICSHVNDGGFWLVKEYFNFTVAQTLKTWTVMTTVASGLGLLLVLLLEAML